LANEGLTIAKLAPCRIDPHQSEASPDVRTPPSMGLGKQTLLQGSAPRHAASG
jgi:hypothetical protein